MSAFREGHNTALSWSWHIVLAMLDRLLCAVTPFVLFLWPNLLHGHTLEGMGLTSDEVPGAHATIWSFASFGHFSRDEGG